MLARLCQYFSGLLILTGTPIIKQGGSNIAIVIHLLILNEDKSIQTRKTLPV